MVDEGGIISLQIMHATSHAGVAFAKSQVIGRICFRRFALRPVPATSILQIDHIDGMSGDVWTLRLLS